VPKKTITFKFNIEAIAGLVSINAKKAHGQDLATSIRNKVIPTKDG